MVVVSVAVSYAMMVRCHRVVRADSERLILCILLTSGHTCLTLKAILVFLNSGFLLSFITLLFM